MCETMKGVHKIIDQIYEIIKTERQIKLTELALKIDRSIKHIKVELLPLLLEKHKDIKYIKELNLLVYGDNNDL